MFRRRPGGIPVPPVSPVGELSTDQPVVTTRTPLYVTTGWKGWRQPDLFPNVALALALSIPPAPVEQTLFKRPVPQIDVLPNIAAQVSVEPPKAIPAPIEPTIWRPRWPTPDVLPNQAVNLQTARPAGTYLDPPLWKARPQTDIYQPLYVAAAVYVPPPMVEPTYFRRILQVDQYENQTAQTAVEPPKSIPSIDWMIQSRRWVQPEYLKNVAVSVQVQGYVPPSPVEPAFRRTQSVPDVFQNIAVYAPPETVFVCSVDAIQLAKIIWTQPDVLPNLAALAVQIQVPLPVSPDPQLAKRSAPQVEIFQNRAVYAPPEAPIMLMALNEPVIWKVRFQFEQAQNLAALVPVAAPTGLHQVNMGVSFGIGMGRIGGLG